MAFNSIPSLWTQVGKPITKQLMDTIRTNLDNLNSRVDTISIAVGSKEIFNDLVEASDDVPVGSIISLSYDELPSGYLLCYGQAISRAEYPELFDAIGTTYGSGDGSTTFNLPDSRGRVIAGRDNMGSVAANRLTTGGAGINGTNLGASGGSQTHTLTAGQVQHNHTMAHTHTVNKNSWNTNQTAHSHGSGGIYALLSLSFDIWADRITVPSWTPSSIRLTGTTQSGPSTEDQTLGVGTAGSTATSTVSWSSANVTSSGSSAANTSAVANSTASAHQNTQPTIVQNHIVKALNVIEESPRLIVKRINETVRINNVILTPSNQGTSGDLEIDIKKGSSIAGASQTIFSSKPVLAWDDTDPQSGATDSNNNLVNAGDYIVVSIDSTQANLKGFHLFIGGDL